MGVFKRFQQKAKSLLGDVSNARTADAARSRVSSDGLVSVVIPSYNVAAYLGLALDSVLAQTYSNLEVVIVDDGSTDATVAIARDYAQRDPRIRVLTQPHGGQGIARNLGIRSAQGAFITFLDADDELPPRAYELMVESLTRSGSDFCIGTVERFTSTRKWRPAWIREVHATSREFVTIDEFPVVIKDILACNRLYRREFWNTQVGEFGEGMVYEDHLPMLVSFLNGAHFDVLTEVTYRWRTRDDGSNTGQQKHELSNLTDRVKVKRIAWAALADASDVVKTAWLARVIDIDFVSYYRMSVDADVEYREVLRAALSDFWTMLEASTSEYASSPFADVRPRSKIAAWLIVEGNWAELAKFFAAFEADVELGRQYLSGDVLGISAARVAEAIGFPLAPVLCESTAFEARAFATLARMKWDSDHSLTVDGLLYLGTVDLTGLDVETSLIIETPQGETSRFSCALGHDAELLILRPTTGLRAPAAFSVTIPFDALPQLPVGKLVARVELRIGEFVATTQEFRTLPGGSARTRLTHLLGTHDGGVLSVKPEVAEGASLTFEVSAVPAVVDSIGIDQGVLSVSLPPLTSDAEVRGIRLREPKSKSTVELRPTPGRSTEGEWSVNLAALKSQPARAWIVEIQLSGGQFKRALGSARQITSSAPGPWRVDQDNDASFRVAPTVATLISARWGGGLRLVVEVPTDDRSWLTGWSVSTDGEPSGLCTVAETATPRQVELLCAEATVAAQASPGVNERVRVTHPLLDDSGIPRIGRSLAAELPIVLSGDGVRVILRAKRSVPEFTLISG